MRKVCYADPPYAGQSKKHYGGKEIDFADLVNKLKEYDAWALSVHVNQLKDLLPICPAKTRIAVWCKPYATFKKGVNPTYAWEPVLFYSTHRSLKQKFVHDFLVCSPVMKAAIVGQKPIEFCFWLFEMLNLKPSDEFTDMFPGSGAVQIAHKYWCDNYFDGEYRSLEPKRTTLSVRDTVGKL
jgi:hypothetical protein